MRTMTLLVNKDKKNYEHDFHLHRGCCHKIDIAVGPCHDNPELKTLQNQDRPQE